MPTLSFSPLLPIAVLALLACLAVAFSIFTSVRRNISSGLMRLLGSLLLLGSLTNPTLIVKEQEPLNDVVALIIDRSASQKLGQRETQTNIATQAILHQLSSLPNLEIRHLEVRENEGGDGTQLFSTLSRAFSDVSPERIAGAIFVTDGIVHDIPSSIQALGFNAPLHALITGELHERDRRIAVVNAPRFGIVGHDLTVRVLIDERGGSGTSRLTVTCDGELIHSTSVSAGYAVPVSIPIKHPRANVIEFEIEPLEGELTAANNRAVLTIEGIRDKLRVLLVSGKPHPGVRTWRNFLKSDANVDLVHFTILRPIEKNDSTPIDELSLIEFPTHTLFQERIRDFDLIILDRYDDLTALPPVYYENIAEYVREGGALLLSTGPEFSEGSSIAQTALGSILPALPDGRIHEAEFLPQVTSDGYRHPVTRDLPENILSNGQSTWGNWLRQIAAKAYDGNVLMSGADGLPLLVLSRYERGRVALILSDHIWLWARGFQGGGPYNTLLRRLSHWLMREPMLEEEELRASAREGVITIERQTLQTAPADITLTAPNGQVEIVKLSPEKPGLFSRRIESKQLGFYRLTDGTLSAFVNVGPDNPKEMLDVFSNTLRLLPIATATGGSVRRIEGEPLPRIKLRSADTTFAGRNWIGLRSNNNFVITNLRSFPLGVGLGGMTLIVLVLLAIWGLEGRHKKNKLPSSQS